MSSLLTCHAHGTVLNGSGQCLACEIAFGQAPAPNEEYKRWAIRQLKDTILPKLLDDIGEDSHE